MGGGDGGQQRQPGGEEKGKDRSTGGRAEVHGPVQSGAGEGRLAGKSGASMAAGLV